MSIVMLAMPWPWYSAIPTALQIVVFTFVAGWYVYLALFTPRAQLTALGGDHRGGWFVWYHAAMMTAMVWMAVAMTPRTPVQAMGMAGMDHTHRMQPGAGSPMMTGSQPWAIPISWVAGVLFAVSALLFLVWFTAQASRVPIRAHRAVSVDLADTGADGVMAAGMATAFLALMV
jgi:hypothetical protein